MINSNIPECPGTFNNETLSDDDAKVKALVNAIVPDSTCMHLDTSEAILDVKRIGYSGGNSPRILKVSLLDVECRNKILRCTRNLNSETIHRTFERVFINKDMSFLRRREEKRLRDAYRQLRARYPEDARLKNGKLFLSQAIKDRIDFRNQLF